ncbi:helix-turn-helix domain-containing protein [Vibrio ichthyoenteri]|nr:helix-turn-helix transcriptional regulator [Vibrio ichthyoenteri]
MSLKSTLFKIESKNEIGTQMCVIEDKIKSVIIRSDLDYTEIAKRCGVERSAVGKWAKTGKISLQNFAKLCSVFNLDPNEILNLRKNASSVSEVAKLTNRINKLDDLDPRISIVNMLLSLDIRY